MKLIKVVDARRDSIVMSRGKNKYCKNYPNGAIVEAEKDTLGIFCFVDKKHAEEWLEDMYEYNYQLLEVKPLTRPRKIVPKIASTINEAGISNFYRFRRSQSKSIYFSQIAPKGTVLVKRVQVLT